MDPEIALKLIFFIILVCSVCLHEFGHAFMANLLGDPLPKAQGRVTLNPMAHADPLGTFLLPFIMIFSGAGLLIGWGKPVMVSLPNAKTRRRDDLLSTFAGPAMNLLICLIASIVFGVVVTFFGAGSQEIFFMIIQLNVILFIFNMIPLPPLDGSHFLRYVGVSDEMYAKISSYSFFILLGLIFLTPFGEFIRSISIIMTNMFLHISKFVIVLLN